MTSSPFPPSISFSSALLRRLFTRQLFTQSTIRQVSRCVHTLCPLDRTSEYSADASILERNGRGSGIAGAGCPASFPSRLRARGRHEFERFRPYRLGGLRSAPLSRGRARPPVEAPKIRSKVPCEFPSTRPPD